MSEPLSQKFIQSLAAPRDHLYTLALTKSGSAHAAENILIQSARALFTQAAADSVQNIPAALESSLTPPTAPDNPTPATPMPADVWARLAAAIQLEAARSSNSLALNPDSVLLRPDPLLAPKKTKPAADLDFDLSSPSRMLYILGAALLAGILITIYILTRPAPPRPATHPASPASLPAPTN